MNTCQTAIAIDSSRSTESTFSNASSASLSCRICQDGNSLEQLINACDCSGSIGLVHPICLEKWLSQSARESCELCQYEFQTTKKVKTFYQFIRRTDLPSIEKHYILADTACFIILTPLGLASSYLCLRGANQYYNNNDFWAGFALVLLSTFLTLLYVFWVSIAIRYHYRSFKEWQKESVEVKIVFPDKNELSVTPNVKSNNNNNENLKNICPHAIPLTHSRRSSTEDENFVETEIIIEKTPSSNVNENTILSRRRSIGKEIDPLIPGPSFTENA